MRSGLRFCLVVPAGGVFKFIYQPFDDVLLLWCETTDVDQLHTSTVRTDFRQVGPASNFYLASPQKLHRIEVQGKREAQRIISIKGERFPGAIPRTSLNLRDPMARLADGGREVFLLHVQAKPGVSNEICEPHVRLTSAGFHAPHVTWRNMANARYNQVIYTQCCVRVLPNVT